VSLRPKKWLFLLPVLLAVALVVWLSRQAEPPQQRLVEPPARVVRTIEVPTVTVVPRALGYGRVQPERVWEAVAEVSGRIIEIHPRVRRGTLLREDVLLLRIDATEFELEVSKVQADILPTRAQLAEMAAREANIRASLAIEQETLKLREAELARKQRLSERGTVSESELEREQQALLAQRQAVQAQQNALNLLPAERDLLEAQLARYQAQLADARLDLARTEVRLPFRARISEVNAEAAQYVREGELLVRADAIDKAEVEAQIPVARMRALLGGAAPVDLTAGETAGIAERLGLRARVTLRDPAGDVTWDARFACISDTFLIDGGRLEIRDLAIGMLQPEYAVIEEGLTAGERLVISDLFPAVEGMRLDGESDRSARQRLLAAATGLDGPVDDAAAAEPASVSAPSAARDTP